jgi:hypothetical protein
MSIVLLIALGVNVIVIIALVAFVVWRRRRLKRQRGEFAGAIRVLSGDIDGLGPAWRHGSGRWDRGVLVWTQTPHLRSNVLIPVDRPTGQPSSAQASGVKRLGKIPVVAEFASNGATIQVASRAKHSALLSGPTIA